jgi:hypothetical protein
MAATMRFPGHLSRQQNHQTERRRTEMEKPNIMVTYQTSPEQKALFQQMLVSLPMS